MFQVGDKIVHPMHGAGVVDSIVSKKVNGVVREYYLLKIPVGGMLVMIPTTDVYKRQFETYPRQVLATAGKVFRRVPVEGSLTRFVAVRTGEDVYLSLIHIWGS